LECGLKDIAGLAHDASVAGQRPGSHATQLLPEGLQGPEWDLSAVAHGVLHS